MSPMLLSATQGLLQEIPALQHFLHAPRGRETSLEKPDVVFRARPASAPTALTASRPERWSPQGVAPNTPQQQQHRWKNNKDEKTESPS